MLYSLALKGRLKELQIYTLITLEVDPPSLCEESLFIYKDDICFKVIANGRK